MVRCSVESRAAGEPMGGTAPLACAWVVLEHPGPWGDRILDSGALPAAVAAHLRTAPGFGVGVLLARRPGTRAQHSGRHAWIARSTPGGLLLREGDLSSYDEVLGWDIAAIGTGQLPAFGTVSRSPVHFVCTNGARDQCCAVEGRSLLAELMTDDSDDPVWECSHVGGHRFAPVLLSLPSGAIHGHVTSIEAREVLRRAAAGEVLVDRYRGRSGLPAPMQTAAIGVHEQEGILGVEDLDVLRVVGDKAVPVSARTPIADAVVLCEVRHHDGRSWRVEVVREAMATARPESCGADPTAPLPWRVAALSAAAPWR